MMIDNNLVFDTANAITTTRDSTNIVDFSVARDMGDGEGLEIMIQPAGLTSTATTTTIQAQVMVSTDNSTYTTAAMSTTIAIGLLSTGSNILNIHVPMRRIEDATVYAAGNDAYPRYMKLNYIVSATLSAGTITAWIGGARQTALSAGYPSGFTVAN